MLFRLGRGKIETSSKVPGGHVTARGQSLPDKPKRTGESARMIMQPPRNFIRTVPGAGLYLVWMQREGPLRLPSVDPDKLAPGLCTGRDAQPPCRRSVKGESDLLSEFAHGARVVIFASVNMPGGR